MSFSCFTAQIALYDSTAKSLQTHRGGAESAEFRGDFLLNSSALSLRPLRLRGEIDLFAVDSLYTRIKRNTDFFCEICVLIFVQFGVSAGCVACCVKGPVSLRALRR